MGVGGWGGEGAMRGGGDERGGGPKIGGIPRQSSIGCLWYCLADSLWFDFGFTLVSL